MLWLNGASTIALTTSGDESASPMPSSPVSVRTRTSTESWLLAVLATTFWIRRIWQTTCVIFIVGPCILDGINQMNKINQNALTHLC